MGDNVFLGDRDGVRTPMQWTGDRNGGFSRADFAQLYLPPLMDPVFGYPAVNVEAQLRSPTSLLRWLRRFIELRKKHPVFGLGTTRLSARTTRGCSHMCAGMKETPCSVCTTSPARRRPSSSISLAGAAGPGGDARQLGIPADRRSPVPADAGAAGLLLVPAHRGGADVSRAEALAAPSSSSSSPTGAGLPRRGGSPRSPCLRGRACRRRLRARVRRGRVPRGHARDLPPAAALRRRRSQRCARPPRRRLRIAALCGVETSCADVRPIGVEQSNSSVVRRRAVRAEGLPAPRRRPEPGARAAAGAREAGFPYAPRLVGRARARRGAAGAALAIVTELVPAAGDGWELTLDALAAGDAEWLPRRARRLGEVTGAMHAALAAPTTRTSHRRSRAPRRSPCSQPPSTRRSSGSRPRCPSSPRPASPRGSRPSAISCTTSGTSARPAS